MLQGFVRGSIKTLQNPREMKPRRPQNEEAQGELWRTELANMVNPEHEMVKLAAVIDWAGLEEAFGESYAEGTGRPAIPTRLMVALHWLKFTHDLSDEEVVRLWVDNPYWQYLSGMRWFEFEAPIDPSSMTRWRGRIGERGAEELLGETVRSGLQIKAIIFIRHLIPKTLPIILLIGTGP